MTDRQTGRVDAIDLFKFIGAFFVITVHTNPLASFFEEANWMLVNIIARLAVYFYFVASAYLFFRGIEFKNDKIVKTKENRQKLKKYVIRTTTLYLIWTIIYMILDLPNWYAGGYLTIKNFIGYGIASVLNTSYYHLWFLLSLIYAIPLMYAMLRVVPRKIVVGLAVCMYIAGLMFGTYSFLCQMPGTSLWEFWGNHWVRLRTVIFNVIPICSPALFCDKVRLNKKALITITSVLIILFSIEGWLLYRFSEATASSYNILLLPTIFFIFLLIKSMDLRLKHYLFLRKMSTLIYCMHPMVIMLFRYAIDTAQLNSMVYFLLVSLITTLLGALLVILYFKYPRLKWIKYLM